MFKVNNKALERRHQRRFGIFNFNFECIPHLFLVFLWLTLNKLMLTGLYIVIQHCKTNKPVESSDSNFVFSYPFSKLTFCNRFAEKPEVSIV